MKLYDMTEKELLIHIASEMEHVKKDVEEIKANCKEQKKMCDGHLGEKVSFRTFVLVVSLVGAIIGFVITQQQVIANEVKGFKKGIDMCDFTDYVEEK